MVGWKVEVNPEYNRRKFDFYENFVVGYNPEIREILSQQQYTFAPEQNKITLIFDKDEVSLCYISSLTSTNQPKNTPKQIKRMLLRTYKTLFSENKAYKSNPKVRPFVKEEI